MKKTISVVILLYVSVIYALNFTGDGGKGISLAMLPPSEQGLTDTDNYLPNMIQGALITNFVKYSAISVVDRLKLETVLQETESGIYVTDADYGRLGQIASVDFVLTGTITKTQSGYALQLQIIETKHDAVGRTRASFSDQFTLEEIENAIAIHKASIELLTQLGVNLTDSAKKELIGSELTTNNIAAQRALAQGIVAQKQGTEVSALSYFFRASAFDPSLLEANNRSSILQANISTGNIGDDLRNDVAHRKQWVERLTELEQFINNMNRSGATPFVFHYSKDIKQGKVDYDKETVTLSIETAFVTGDNMNIALSNVLKVLYDGLTATSRIVEWGLDEWPKKSIIVKNAFGRQNRNFVIELQLLNDKKKILSNHTFTINCFWVITLNNNFDIQTSMGSYKTIDFQNVSINDITDNLSINIISVNGKNPEFVARTGILQIISGDLPLGIGREGPAGGIIFYDKGSYSDGWRFLEAAPVNYEFLAEWGANTKDITGTKTTIGAGKENTRIIVKYLNTKGEKDKAAQRCVALNINGFNDWFLPSKYELDLLYNSIINKGLGDYSGTYYWSSSQNYSYYAWYQCFINGDQRSIYKNYNYKVRAIRTF